MKFKNHILFVLMAITVIACTKGNTDIDMPLGEYIFFTPKMMEIEQVKAGSSNQFEGEEFGVLGYYSNNQTAIFGGYENNIALVYKDDNGVFKYDKLAPWLEGTHTFYGFYPYSLSNTVTTGDDNMPYIAYTQPDDAEKMTDILGSKEVVENPQTEVQLHFQHLLWKFTIDIKNSQTEEIIASGTTIENPYINIKSVTITINNLLKEAQLKLDDDFTVVPGTAYYDQPVSYTMFISTDGVQIPAKETETSKNTETFGPLFFVPTESILCNIRIDYTTEGGYTDSFIYPAADEYIELTYNEESETGFNKGNVYNLTINKVNGRFILGAMINEGAWGDVTVNHEFN